MPDSHGRTPMVGRALRGQDGTHAPDAIQEAAIDLAIDFFGRHLR